MRNPVWILLLLTGLWAVDAWLGLGVFWEHDLRHHHIPWRVWASEEWAGGRIPLWNPDVGSGFALTADGQTGTFYFPTMLLFGLLPASVAVNLSILGHVAWAAEGMRRLMGHVEVQGPAALLAAIAFAFSGFMTTHAGYLGMQNVAAWIPWLAAAAVVGRWAPVGLCAAMMMVAGHPQVAVIGLLGGAAIAAWKKNIHLFCVGVLVAAIAASPQILATAELVDHSIRAGGVSSEFARTGALPFQELLSTVLPNFFGLERPADILQSYVHRGDGYWGGGVSHWDTAVYLGIPVSVLAVLGARGRYFWLGMSLVSVLLMTASPLWEALRLLPVFDTMRYPARFSVLLTLAVAVLSGHGLERLRHHPNPSRIVNRVVAAAGIGVFGMAAGTRLLVHNRTALLERLTSRYSERPDWSSIESSDRALQIVDGLTHSLNPAASENLFAMGLLMGFAALVWLRTRQMIPMAGLALGVLALGYADFWVVGHEYNVRTPRVQVDLPPSAIARIGPVLQQGRIAVVDRRRHPDLDKELINANMGLQYGLSDVVVPSPLRNVRNDALVSKLGLDIGDRGAEKWVRVTDNLNLLNLMGVRWLFSEHPQPGRVFSQHMANPIYVYENTQAMPREFLVACVEKTDDPWSALDTLQPQVWAIVEEDVGLSECRTPLNAGSIEVELNESDHRIMTVYSPMEALLVSVETHDSGWIALVDGEAQTIHRVNWNFRGIRVPAGTSTVQMVYRPAWLSAAVPMASLAWLGLLFGFIRRDD